MSFETLATISDNDPLVLTSGASSVNGKIPRHRRAIHIVAESEGAYIKLGPDDQVAATEANGFFLAGGSWIQFRRNKNQTHIAVLQGPGGSGKIRVSGLD